MHMPKHYENIETQMDQRHNEGWGSQLEDMVQKKIALSLKPDQLIELTIRLVGRQWGEKERERERERKREDGLRNVEIQVLEARLEIWHIHWKDMGVAFGSWDQIGF